MKIKFMEKDKTTKNKKQKIKVKALTKKEGKLLLTKEFIVKKNQDLLLLKNEHFENKKSPKPKIKVASSNVIKFTEQVKKK